MNFESALRSSLEATPDLRRRGKRILQVLDGRNTPRKQRVVRRMEAHVRAHLDLGRDAIDWGKIDWPSLIEGVLKLLLALLPLLLL